MANVQHGDRNRRPCEDHITYLETLGELLANWPTDRPLVVAGDFNQRLTKPMKRGGRSTEPMYRCFEQMDTPTIGVVPGWPKEENDHIATRGLAASDVTGWPNVVDGVRCSDHGGVLVEVSPTGAATPAVANTAPWPRTEKRARFARPLSLSAAELAGLGIVVKQCDPAVLPRSVITHTQKHVVLLKPKRDASSGKTAGEWELLRKGLSVERTLQFAYNAFWNGNDLHRRGLALTYVVDQATSPWTVWSVDGRDMDVGAVNALFRPRS